MKIYFALMKIVFLICLIYAASEPAEPIIKTVAIFAFLILVFICLSCFAILDKLDNL